MKPFSLRLVRIATAALMFSCLPAAIAFDRYWDGTDSTADADGGTGTWDTVTSNWDDLATGGLDSLFTAGDNVFFGGTAGTVSTAAAFSAGTVTFNTSGYIIDTGANAMTWGTLAGTGGFTKAGAATLTLTNASSASGNVTINAGRITLGNNTALGTTAVTLNGGTIERNVAGATVANAISIGASGGTILGRQVVDNYADFSGQITGSGALTVQGLVTLSNNTNTYAGPLTISNASSTYLRLSTNGVLGSTTDITFGGTNSRLRLDGGVTQTIDALSGTAGEVFMSAFGTPGTAATLKVGNDGSTSSYGGTFANNDGQFNLEKIGAGTLTLNRGAGNGAQITSVKVSAGKLVLDGNGPVAFDAGYFTGTQTYTVTTGGTLEINRAWNTRGANVYNINGGTLSFTATAGDTNYVNNLNLTNGTVSGGEFRSGNNTLATHTFAGDSGNTISSTLRMIKNGAAQTIRFDVANGAAANDLTVSGIIKDDTSFTGSTVEKTGAGTMLVTNANAYSGPTLISQGTLVTNTNNGLGTAGTVTLNSATTSANNTALYAQVASSGDLVLSRPITVANLGSGTTTIGTNRSGAGRTFFDGLVTINKNTTLSGMLTDRTQYRGGIRGTGNLTVSGGSRTTFSDSTADTEAAEGSALYDFTGNLTLTGTGTLIQFNSDIELTNAPTVTVETGTTLRSAYGKTMRINALAGAGEVTSVAGSGTLVVGIAGGSGNFSGVISGTGGDALKVTKTGAGNQTFSGAAANTYSGLTTVNGGTLTLDKNDGVIAIAGHVTVTGTGTLTTSDNKSGRIADASNVTIDGSSALFQLGANQNDTINTLAVNNGGTVNIGGTSSNLRPNGGITSTGGGSITMTAGGAGLNFNAATRTITVSDNTLAIAAPITNGGLTKAGNGTLTLSAASTYTGATSVNAGTLLVNGSTASGSAVSVAANANLGGTGTINGATTVSGNLNAGNGGTTRETLAFGSTLNLATAQKTTFDLAGAATRGTTYDGIDVTGALTYGGILELNFASVFAGGTYTFDLFNLTSQSGDFSAVNLIGAYTGSLTNSGGLWSLSSGGNSWQFTQSTGDLAFTAVPEPTSALAGLLLGAGLLRRRRKA